MPIKKPVNGGAFAPPETIARAKRLKKRHSEHQTKLKILSVCSGTLFGLGTYWLIDPQSVAHWVEVTVIGVAGGVANYAINGVCITRGAYQAASEVKGAAAASVGAILTTGLTISTVSFVGLTINTIDQMELQDFGRENSLYVDAYVSGVRQSDEVIVAVEAAFEQVSGAAECERAASCVSLRGNGGEGKTYFTLKGIADQIGSVQESLGEGESLRDHSLERLAETESELQIALNASTGSRKARRAQVQELLADQRRALSDLERALPLSVVTGLAETLQTGVETANDRDLAQKINARLAPAGKGIDQALAKIEIGDLERPSIPAETGVMKAMEWVGFFLPLFAMLILIDTLFPMLLWFFAFSALRPLVEPEEDEVDRDPFSVSGVLDAPPVQLGHTPNSSQRGSGTKD